MQIVVIPTDFKETKDAIASYSSYNNNNACINFFQAAKMYSFGLTLDSAGSIREASQSKHRTGRNIEDEGSDKQGAKN